MKFVVKRTDRSGFAGDVAVFAFSGDAREYARSESIVNAEDRFDVGEVLLWSVSCGKAYVESRTTWCAYVNGDSLKVTE